MKIKRLAALAAAGVIILAGCGAPPADDATTVPDDTVTTEENTDPTSDTSQEGEDGSLAAAVQAGIDDQLEGGDYTPSWAAPITEIEDVSAGTIRVHYQEELTDDEAAEVARAVTTFTMNSNGTEDLDTVVVRDTSGVDRNFFRRNMGI